MKKKDYHLGETWGIITFLVSLYPFVKWFGEIGFLYSLILAAIIYFICNKIQFSK